MRLSLDLALGSSTQERCGSVGNGLEEGYEIIKGVQPLSYEQRLRGLGGFRMEKRRLQGDIISAFQSL